MLTRTTSKPRAKSAAVSAVPSNAGNNSSSSSSKRNNKQPPRNTPSLHSAPAAMGVLAAAANNANATNNATTQTSNAAISAASAAAAAAGGAAAYLGPVGGVGVGVGGVGVGVHNIASDEKQMPSNSSSTETNPFQHTNTSPGGDTSTHYHHHFHHYYPSSNSSSVDSLQSAHATNMSKHLVLGQAGIRSPTVTTMTPTLTSSPPIPQSTVGGSKQTTTSKSSQQSQLQTQTQPQPQSPQNPKHSTSDFDKDTTPLVQTVPPSHHLTLVATPVRAGTRGDDSNESPKEGHALLGPNKSHGPVG